MSGARVRPVTMSSIVSPQPGSGTLTAMIKDAEGRPVVNMPVQAAQEGTGFVATKRTNDAGCAVFGTLSSGAYAVRLDQSGWVDPEGNQAPEQSVTVNSGILSTVEFLYDLKAQINPSNVVTYIGGVRTTDEAAGVVVAHDGLQTGFRVFPGTATAFNLDRLFPFRNPYRAYAGTCTGADPALWIPTYFDDRPPFDERLERGTTYGPVDLIEPYINVRARRGTTSSNSNLANAYIIADQVDESCDGERVTLGPTGSSGTVTRPGVPFGDYVLCAQYTDTSFNPDRTWHVVGPTITNRDPAGHSTSTAARINLIVPNSPSGGNGGCPSS
jgi:hypothetical protein